MRAFTDRSRHSLTLRKILKHEEDDLPRDQKRDNAIRPAEAFPLDADHTHILTLICDKGGEPAVRFTLQTDEHYAEHTDFDGVFNVLIQRPGNEPDLQAEFATWIPGMI